MNCFNKSNLCRMSSRVYFAIAVAIFTALLSDHSHAATPQSGAATAATSAPFDVKVTGTGPDVLLIPGLASSGATWDGVVAHLAPHYRCHVLTLAGFAGVPAVSGPPLDNAEAAIDAYVKAQHLDAPIVVGHSLGGFLGLRLAIDHPDDVGRLVVVDALPALGAAQMDSATPGQLRQFAVQMRAQMAALDADKYAAGQAAQIATMVTAPADVARLQGWGRTSDRATVVAAMTDMIGDDLRPRMARVHAPTLVMGTWAVFARQYRDLAGVRIEMAPTARHFVMLDDPAWFDATLDTFLR